MQKTFEKGEVEVDLDNWKIVENSNVFVTQTTQKSPTDAVLYTANHDPVSQTTPTPNLGSSSNDVGKLKSSDSSQTSTEQGYFSFLVQ